MNARLLPIASLLLLAACSSSRNSTDAMTAFTDPAFAAVRFSRVAVFAETSDLGWRKEMETQIVTALQTGGFEAYASHTFLPPTRDWSAGERRDALRGRGIDAYLMLRVDTSGVDEWYVEPVTTTTITRERKPEQEKKEAEQKGNTVEKEKEEITTKTHGGYLERRHWTRYRISLIESATDRTVWLGVNVISGDRGRRIESFSEEIVMQLKRDDRLAGP